MGVPNIAKNLQLFKTFNPFQAQVEQEVRWMTVVLSSTRDDHVLTFRNIESEIVAFDPVVYEGKS